MPFRTAISGLNASSAELRVIGNNIANAGTVGFKGSRAEFADVLPVSKLGTGTLSVGSGVQLSGVRQQFGQGNINFTNNNFDLAVNGQGFFRMSENGAISYSRNGAFGLDDEGYVVNSSGLRLTGFQATNGTVTGTQGELQLSLADNDPKTTAAITANLNLDATEVAKDGGDPALALTVAALQDDGTPFVPPRFEPPPADSYNQATSFTGFDSLGVPHTITTYFRKTGNNAWTVEMSLDNQAFVAPAEGTAITFDNTGSLITPAGPPVGTLTYAAIPVGTGAADMAYTIALEDTTQFGAAFGVNSLTQDGFTTGRLASVDVDSAGIIFGRYTNGQSQALGQALLANFNNPEGLRQLGDTTWTETAASGSALVGTPGSSSLGVIQSGALEDSNVDLTQQLVQLITAQRNFQANAQVINTADQITQTIINLR
ncbi:MAG: flagellar hook protein FlgE [Gammaproteobacteria bacterium]|nr:flagellar hook protein FlgE [Gammaproteobacteria bacterium]